MRRRRKTSTLVTGAVMAVVLTVGGIASKNLIVEQWNIYKLETGDEDEVKAAAKILGELRSERAVPHLVRHLSKWTEEDKWILLETRIVTVRFNQEVKDALLSIGANAVPALMTALKNENEDSFKCAITFTPGEIGPAAISAVPELEWVGRLASDENLGRIVHWALARIEGHWPHACRVTGTGR